MAKRHGLVIEASLPVTQCCNRLCRGKSVSRPAEIIRRDDCMHRIGETRGVDNG